MGGVLLQNNDKTITIYDIAKEAWSICVYGIQSIDEQRKCAEREERKNNGID